MEEKTSAGFSFLSLIMYGMSYQIGFPGSMLSYFFIELHMVDRMKYLHGILTDFCRTFRIPRKNHPVPPVFSRTTDAVRSANPQVMPVRLRYESRFPRKSRITSKRFELTTSLYSSIR